MRPIPSNDLLRKPVRDGILPAAAITEAPLLPITNSHKLVVSTTCVEGKAARPCVSLTKSHLNNAPVLCGWEKQAVERLEEMDAVGCFAPAGHLLGFTVPHDDMEASLSYEPDFVIRLRGGIHLVRKIRGQGGEIHGGEQVLGKNEAAKKWVAAINNSGRLERKAFEIGRDLGRLRTITIELVRSRSSKRLGEVGQ